MVSNLLSKRRGERDAMERISEAFDGRALSFPSCDSGNVVAFAAAGPVHQSIGELKTLARTLKNDTGLNLLPTITRLEGSRHCPGGRVRF
jgi:spermidine synthase